MHGIHHGNQVRINGDLSKSTLLNETGNIELYRVSEETKKKVAEESQRIKDKMASCNAKSRKQFYQEENRKIRAHENNFKDMVARWDIKTKNSPFRVNQFEKEERRLKAVADREYNKSVEDYRNETIDNMIGTRRFDAYNEDTAHLIHDDTMKLALALRKQVTDKAIVHRERGTLDQMIDIQYSEMKHKFPAVEGFQSIVTTANDQSLLHKNTHGLNGGHSFSSSSGSRGGSRQAMPPQQSTKRALTSSGSNVFSGGGGKYGSAVRSGTNTSSGSRSAANGSVSRDASYGDMSLESGSGSIYKPPPANAADLFVQELEGRFERV